MMLLYLAVLFLLNYCSCSVHGELEEDLPTIDPDTDEIEECYRQFGEDSFKPHPDIDLKLDEIIIRYGYLGETHKVQTKDGYILTLFRIIGSPLSPPSSKKPPVYLNHGIFCNGHIWFLQHGSRNLAFKLADNGFDVWIGNARGTDYSLEHIELHSNDIRYWNFTWDEMGIHDLPSSIEKIRRVSGYAKIFYIGHSMANTEYFVMMSQHPHMNDYISTAVMYAPVVHLSNTKQYRLFSSRAAEIFRKLDKVVGGRVDAKALFKDELFGMSMSEMCSWKLIACSACSEIQNVIFGRNPTQTNYTMISLLTSISPQVVPIKNLAHYAQVINSGQFKRFDYGKPELNEIKYGPGNTSPPEYDLSKLTAPVVFFWSDNDLLLVPKDVVRLVKGMNPLTLKANIRVDMPEWTHNDFVKAIDADKYIYDQTIEILKSQL